jgi:hypothetical protein
MDDDGTLYVIGPCSTLPEQAGFLSLYFEVASPAPSPFPSPIETELRDLFNGYQGYPLVANNISTIDYGQCATDDHTKNTDYCTVNNLEPGEWLVLSNPD